MRRDSELAMAKPAQPINACKKDRGGRDVTQRQKHEPQFPVTADNPPHQAIQKRSHQSKEAPGCDENSFLRGVTMNVRRTRFVTAVTQPQADTTVVHIPLTCTTNIGRAAKDRHRLGRSLPQSRSLGNERKHRKFSNR
jgi:hypothetical protein